MGLRGTSTRITQDPDRSAPKGQSANFPRTSSKRVWPKPLLPAFAITKSLRPVFSRSESCKIMFTNSQQHLQTGRQQSSGSNVPDLFVNLLPLAISFHELLIHKSAKGESATRLVPRQKFSSIRKREPQRSQQQVLWRSHPR